MIQDLQADVATIENAYITAAYIDSLIVSGDLIGTNGIFSGELSGATGTFTGTVQTAGEVGADVVTASTISGFFITSAEAFISEFTCNDLNGIDVTGLFVDGSGFLKAF